MSLEEKRKRHDQIVALFESGYAPGEIAKKFGHTSRFVRQVLSKRGIKIMPPELNRPSMWDLDENKRREAIIKRAAKGARETLKKIAPVEKCAPLAFHESGSDNASSSDGRFVLANMPAAATEAREPCRAPDPVNTSVRSAA
jgi:hypothetical protein